MTGKTRTALLRLAGLVVLLAVGVYFFRFTETGRTVTPQSALEYIRSFDPLAARAVYVAAYVVGTVCLLPGTVLSFAGAALFGPYEGTLYTWIGATLGATLAFFLARLLGRAAVVDLVGDRLDTLDRRLRHHGFTGLLLLRLLPIVPFNALNFGAGLTGIGVRDYVLATAVGILPGTFVYQFLFAKAIEKGTQGELSWDDLRDPELLLALGLFAAFLVVGKWLAGRVSVAKES